VASAALKEALSSLGFRELRRIVVGWQSLAVYDARVDRQRVAVKVLDPKVVERSALGVRLDVQSKLATAADIVCVPVLVGDGLVNETAVESAGTVYAVARQFAEGGATTSASGTTSSPATTIDLASCRPRPCWTA
jgi:hypothetical protein